MKRVLAIALAALLLGFFSAINTGLVSGQSPGAGESGATAPAVDLPAMEERIRRLEAFRLVPDEDLAFPEPPQPGDHSEKTLADYQETLQAYYRYRQQGYEHRLEVFQWQLLTTKITFVVVLILVFAGIYFAAIQFHHGLRKPPEEGGQRDEATEFVFSFREFKVRSPVLGVIVLTLSLAFFYLYLVYVYPIEDVF